MSTEHTQGSLTKEAIRLAWPAVCESFFIALAGTVHRSECSNLRPGGETIWREEAAGGQRDSGDDDLLLHSGSSDHQRTDGRIRGSDH